jgi:hypothetical protein
MKLTSQQLTEYPIKSISLLYKRASQLVEGPDAALFYSQLGAPPETFKRILAVTVDSMELENRQLRERIAEMESAIARLKEVENRSDLGDK